MPQLQGFVQLHASTQRRAAVVNDVVRPSIAIHSRVVRAHLDPAHFPFTVPGIPS
jgi:hypothetical protein